MTRPALFPLLSSLKILIQPAALSKITVNRKAPRQKAAEPNNHRVAMDPIDNERLRGVPYSTSEDASFFPRNKKIKGFGSKN